MNYLQFLALTLGLRWLIGYIFDCTTPRIVAEYSKAKKKDVEFRYRLALWIVRIAINYCSYRLLKYSLPILIKVTIEMIRGM